MLLPSGNPFKCYEEVLYLQPMIPPKRFDISPPNWGVGGYSEDLDAFIFFFKKKYTLIKFVPSTKKQDKLIFASKTLMMCTYISSARIVSRLEFA